MSQPWRVPLADFVGKNRFFPPLLLMEKTLPPLEITFPPLENTFPPLENIFPPLENTFPPLENTFPPLENTFPPVMVGVQGFSLPFINGLKKLANFSSIPGVPKKIREASFIPVHKNFRDSALCHEKNAQNRNSNFKHGRTRRYLKTQIKKKIIH